MYKLSPFTYSFSKSGKTKKIFSKEAIVFNKDEMVAIIGPSGGGKSTFLKILKGIIPEYSSGVLEGELTFFDKKLHGDNFQHNLKKILYLFQNPFSQIIYPNTEEEFLFSMENFNYTVAEMDREIERFEKLFDLKKLWGKKTAELSHGQCQKLVLSSLLAINPDVLLLDEPTAFLDPEARKEFYQFLKKISGDRLIIIVDHHVEEIMPMVTRVIEVKKNGEIIEGKFEQVTALELPAVELPPLAPVSDVTLEIINLTFSYLPGQTLLSELNAFFRGGEVVAIKGLNGAGKSTLFKVMAGVLKAQKGAVELRVGNKKYQNQKTFSQVGFIFQNPETHFFFDSIEEELDQSFKTLSSDKMKIKDDLLARYFYDIDLKKSPFLLSEGEKRRLSILMTVFLNKALLLYDEPTFGQDKKSIEEIILLIKELKKLGLVQLFISHDESFISKVADRVLVLKAGSLCELA